MTRQEIHNIVLGYLNRLGDTGLTDALLPFWFEVAHRDIQRRHNFVGSEITDITTTTMENGLAEYPIPTNIKIANLLYVWNPLTELVETIYNPTDLNTIRSLRYNRNAVHVDNPLDPSGSYYAPFEGSYHLFPTPGSGQHDKTLGIDGYGWIAPPILAESDWFTENAFDYLVYRMLIESIPVLGMSDSDARQKLFTGLSEISFGRIMGVSVKQKHPGPLTIRG